MYRAAAQPNNDSHSANLAGEKGWCVKLPRLSPIGKFKADTGATVDQFLARKITLPDCLTALADALTRIKAEVSREEFPAITDIVIANNAKVMREAEKRERNRKASREYYRNSKTKIQT
jgi:hypothetical protein